MSKQLIDQIHTLVDGGFEVYNKKDRLNHT